MLTVFLLPDDFSTYHLPVVGVAVVSESDDYMGLMVGVVVVLRIPLKLFGDLKEAQIESVVSNLFARLGENLVDIGKNSVARLAGEDLANDFFTDLFGKKTPITTNHIKTLDFLLVEELLGIRWTTAGNSQSCVLLLFEKQERAEDAINVNFQVLVELVHLRLELKEGIRE